MKKKRFVFLNLKSFIAGILLFCLIVSSPAMSIQPKAAVFIPEDVMSVAKKVAVNAKDSATNTAKTVVNNVTNSFNNLKNEVNNIGDSVRDVLLYPFIWYADKTVSGDPSGGVHGGGGASRDTATPVNKTPIESPAPIYNNTTKKIYNTVNNSYETVNNIYNVVEDNSVTNYIYETTNNYITYSYNYTYVTTYVCPKETPESGGFFNIYYQTPDGRSSFNLTPEDLKGIVFTYDVINYQKTTVDSSIGIWHLDNNFYNSVDNSIADNQDFNNFVGGRFDSCYRLSYDSREEIVLSFDNEIDLTKSYILDFWMWVPDADSTYYTDNANSSGNNNAKSCGNFPTFIPKNQWHNIKLVISNQICTKAYCDGTKIDAYKNLFNGFGFASGSISQPFVKISSTGLTFCTGAKIGTKSVGNVTYDCYPWYTCAFDEVRLYPGTLGSDIVDVRQIPWDLSFAYTVPYDTFEFDLMTSEEVSDYYNLYYYSDTYVSPFVKAALSVSGKGSLNFGTAMKKHVDGSFINASGIYVESTNIITGRYYYFKYRSLGTDFAFEVLDQNDVVVYRTTSPIPDDRQMIQFIYNRPEYFIKGPLFIGNFIAVQSPYVVNGWRIGGIRNTMPSIGEVFINLEGPKVSSVQQYYNGMWNLVEAAVFYRDKWYDVKTFNFDKMVLIEDDNLNYSSGSSTIYNIYNNYYGDENTINNYFGDDADLDDEDFESWELEELDLPNLPNGDAATPQAAGFLSADFIVSFLPLAAAIALFMIFVKVLMLFINGLQYIALLITIPASVKGLPADFVKAFSWLRGRQIIFDLETGEPLDEPFYLLNFEDIGLKVTVFDFMVIIFQIFFFGAILSLAKKVIEKFDFHRV